MTNPAGESPLAEHLERLGISLPADQLAQLDRYCRLLWEWNEQLNLTRHTTHESFAVRDVWDSWQLAQLLEPGESVLDVGTGGGVPGIILAILRPDLRVSVSESVQKKAHAVNEMVAELDLPISVFAARAEEVLELETFDVLVARAAGPLSKMLHWFQPHWRNFGRLLAVKGPKWVEERGEARHRGLLRELNLRKAASYPMPGTGSDSVILKIWPRRPLAGSPPGD